MSTKNKENDIIPTIIICLIIIGTVTCFWKFFLALILGGGSLVALGRMFETKDEKHERWRRERLRKYGRY